MRQFGIETQGIAGCHGKVFCAAAIHGVTAEGPTDQPTLITGWTGFYDQFGGFIWGNYLPYAVYSFFAQGGDGFIEILKNVGVLHGSGGDWSV